MYKIVFIAIISLMTSCNKPQEEKIPGRNGYKTDTGKTEVVTPSVEPGSSDEETSTIQLKAGKLIGLTQVNETNCIRANKANLCIDMILSDSDVFKAGITNEELEQMFVKASAAIQKTGVSVWGIHLPYQNVNIANTDETKRAKNVAAQKNFIDLSMKYLKPMHFVIHPSTGDHYTTDEKYSSAKAASRKSLAELQQHLDSYNSQTILCVENCPKGIAYDAESLLDLLSVPGLEKVRICLDTGHSLIPLNGEYRSPIKNGDAVADLKKIGTRLGTLHIQQNHGAEGVSGVYDIHIEPFIGGLIDWGEFYHILLTDCMYRGCFLYEVSYIKTHKAETSSIETVAKNYKELIYPAYLECIGK